jgi:hypothetical protein
MTMTADHVSHDAVAEAREFLRQRDAIRAALREERERLLARLHEIDTALVDLGDRAPAAEAPAGTERDGDVALDVVSLRSASAPALVEAILERHRDGLTAAALLGAARRIQPGVNAALLHATLYRLGKPGGKVRHRGQRGQRIYSLVRKEAGGG